MPGRFPEPRAAPPPPPRTPQPGRRRTRRRSCTDGAQPRAEAARPPGAPPMALGPPAPAPSRAAPPRGARCPRPRPPQALRMSPAWEAVAGSARPWVERGRGLGVLGRGAGRSWGRRGGAGQGAVRTQRPALRLRLRPPAGCEAGAGVGGRSPRGGGREGPGSKPGAVLLASASAIVPPPPTRVPSAVGSGRVWHQHLAPLASPRVLLPQSWGGGGGAPGSVTPGDPAAAAQRRPSRRPSLSHPRGCLAPPRAGAAPRRPGC